MRGAQTFLFTRRLADLTTGGLPLSRCLEILRKQSRKKNLQVLLGSIQTELEQGKSFSQALSAQNGFFPPVFVGMVRSAESSGNLEETLQELARLLESEMETRQRLQAALAYPAFLLVLALAVTLLLFTFVIPRFEFLFQDLGQRLPLPTRILIQLSSVLKKGGWLLFPIILSAFAWIKRKKGNHLTFFKDQLFRLPGLSEVIMGTFLQRWSQVMASLLRSGLTVPAALELSRKAVGSQLLVEDLRKVSIRVLEGPRWISSCDSRAAQSPGF